MNKLTGLFISLIVICTAACELTITDNGTPPENQILKSFAVSFKDPASNTRTIYGKIEGSAITVTVPTTADITRLTPIIEARGSISSNMSGEVNFIKPVSFTITTESDEYSFTVTVLKEENINAFYFEQAKNSGNLTSDAIGEIIEKEIRVVVPNDTNLVGLVPTIEFDGLNVALASVGTPDFSYPVWYKHTSSDGKIIKHYKVTVTKAEESNTDIIRFEFKKELNIINLKGDLDVIGKIEGNAQCGNETCSLITATVPYNTELKSLMPTIAITGKSIFPFSGALRDFSIEQVYTVTAKNGTTKKYLVRVTMAPDNRKEITGFSLESGNNNFDHVIGTIDTVSRTITVTVPCRPELKTITPTITKNSATMEPASGVQRAFEDANGNPVPITYKLTAADKTVAEYRVVVRRNPGDCSSITKFAFSEAENPGFPGCTITGEGLNRIVEHRIDGEFIGKYIYMQVPYGTDLTKLKPYIEYTGGSIDPPLGTARDFSKTLTYTVQASETKSKSIYSVIFKMGSENVRINSFAFQKSDNPDLGEDAHGFISGSYIFVRMYKPFFNLLHELKPRITHSGGVLSPTDGETQTFEDAVEYILQPPTGPARAYWASVVPCLNGDKDITSFKFTKEDNDELPYTIHCVINENNKTITGSVPYSVGMNVLMSMKPRINYFGQMMAPETGETHDFRTTVPYTVTAIDGTISVYHVNMIIEPNTEKEMTGFRFTPELNPGTLTTTAQGVISDGSVTLTVPYGIDLTKLIPVIESSAESKVSFTQADTSVVEPASGVSRDFKSPVTYRVTAQNGTTKDFTVTVNYGPPSDNAYCTDIQFSRGSLTPTFDSQSYNYTLLLESANREFEVSANPSFSGASVIINGTSMASGAKLKIVVDQSALNKIIAVKCIAQNGSSFKEYTINVRIADIKEISSFEINGIKGSIKDGSITVILPESTDVKNLTPQFTYTGKEVRVHGEVQESGVHAQDFTKPVEYTAIACDGSATTYYVRAFSYTWRERVVPGAGKGTWTSITSSSDGMKLAAVNSTDYIYTSTDSGATWTERRSAGEGAWTSITSSSDGTRLAAVAYGGYIQTSTDGGATWIERKSVGNNAWFCITSSSDGMKLAAGQFFGNYIYTSTDGGAIWTKRASAGSRNWKSITSSSNGMKLAAVDQNGYIYTSENYGETWTERISAGSRSWQSITSSSDGTKLAVVASNGCIYTSIDSGLTFVERTSSPNYGWTSITSSSDGTKLAALSSSGSIYTSMDSGKTWVECTSAGHRYWTSIASSSDGMKLSAVVDNGYIYTSTDSGTKWVERTLAGSRHWSSISSSSDGMKLVAINNGGYIYTSADAGLTWIEHTLAGSRYWSSISSSSDGMKLVAVNNGGYIYTSADAGLTWIEHILAGSRYWSSISSSSDGMKLVAVNNGGYIYTSPDSGATWTERTSAGSRQWTCIASSADGTLLAAVASDGYIYTSTDSGSTWTERTSAGSRQWTCIASSADGTLLAAVASDGYIYTSTDSGSKWTERTSVGRRYWKSITSSSDGTKLAAVVGDANNGSYIYTSTDSGSTWTERTSAGSRIWTSIASSADGTQLAAAPDNFRNIFIGN